MQCNMDLAVALTHSLGVIQVYQWCRSTTHLDALVSAHRDTFSRLLHSFPASEQHTRQPHPLMCLLGLILLIPLFSLRGPIILLAILLFPVIQSFQVIFP